MEDWKTCAYVFSAKQDTILDQVEIFLPAFSGSNVRARQFSRLRSWIKSVYPLPEDREDRKVVLRVLHTPSGEELRWKIHKEGKKYRTLQKGELITLEASVKLMKEEITEWLRGAE